MNDDETFLVNPDPKWLPPSKHNGSEEMQKKKCPPNSKETQRDLVQILLGLARAGRQVEAGYLDGGGEGADVAQVLSRLDRFLGSVVPNVDAVAGAGVRGLKRYLRIPLCLPKSY